MPDRPRRQGRAFLAALVLALLLPPALVGGTAARGLQDAGMDSVAAALGNLGLGSAVSRYVDGSGDTGTSPVDAVDRRGEAASRSAPEPRPPTIATVDDIAVVAPSDRVELLGFHQAGLRSARTLRPAGPLASTTLPGRSRGTDRRSAVDVVVHPDRPVRAPVTGEVVEARDYALYCRHRDARLAIRPDANPDRIVKLLHVTGLTVAAGDRVEAGATVVARRPTPLPFSSQVDRFTHDRDWPHVHIEVQDPSVPSPGRATC